VQFTGLPSRDEHYPFLLPHEKEIAMGIFVILNKRYMRAMATQSRQKNMSTILLGEEVP